MKSGSMTLKDAINEAIRDWVTNVRTTHYLLGSVVGPHPYPMMVRDFQSVIGREARQQMLDAEGRLPDYAVACVGGGSNAMGLFYPFIGDEKVRLVGVEAAGEGIESGHHASSLGHGRPGVLHGSNSYLLQDAHGQVMEAHSISAGLDYPGVGPEHSHLKSTGRASLCVGDRRSGPGGFPFAKPLRGDNTGPGILARGVPRRGASQDAQQGPNCPGEPVGAGGQGHRYGGAGHGDGDLRAGNWRGAKAYGYSRPEPCDQSRPWLHGSLTPS